jgi:hypothetical protein
MRSAGRTKPRSHARLCRAADVATRCANEGVGCECGSALPLDRALPLLLMSVGQRFFAVREGVLSDLSMHHWHGLLPRPCPAGGSPASAYPALELVPRRSPRLSIRALASSAVYGVNFYEFANGCFICRWLAPPRVPTCEAPMGFGPSLHRSRLQSAAAGKKGARCRAMTDAHRQWISV